MSNSDKAGPARKVDQNKYASGYDRIFSIDDPSTTFEPSPLAIARIAMQAEQRLTYGETVRLMEYTQQLEEELEASA